MNASKRKRSAKSAAAATILLAVMLAASACGGNGPANGGNDTQGEVNQGSAVDLPDESGVMEPDVSTPEPDGNAGEDANGGASEETEEPSINNGEGTYTGMIDAHSIEIVTASGPMTFEITEDQVAFLDSLPADAKVKFDYTQKAVEGESGLYQNLLVKIEEAK